MNWKDRIITNLDVLLSKPVVKGTRLSFAFLLDLKSSGGPDEQTLKSYP
jgi:uncharacterized protein (DUF433 family)